MRKSDELKQEIAEKRAEVEKLQQEGKVAAAKVAAKELLRLVDEHDIQEAKEKSEIENLMNSNPMATGASKSNALSGELLNKFYKKAGVEGEEYRANFLNALRGKFKNNTVDYLRESSLPDGGYLLPTELHKDIVTDLEEENVMRQLGTTIATESTHRIPIVATKPIASWVGESEQISFASESFAQISLEAYKLAVAIKVSNELLADSFYPIEQHLTWEFAKAFGRAEEDAFLNGAPDPLNPPIKSPIGLLTTLATSPSTTISTASSAVVVDDLLNLEFSLKRPYRKKAAFLMSDSMLSIVRKMKDQVGRFIWEPSLTESEPAKLFGYPVFTSPFMPTLESGNIVVLFGDFKDYYVIGERGQKVFKPLRELYAMSDQTAFLMLERIDARLTNLEAIKALRLS